MLTQREKDDAAACVRAVLNSLQAEERVRSEIKGRERHDETMGELSARIARLGALEHKLRSLG